MVIGIQLRVMDLESRYYVNKVIPKVVKDDGTVVTKQKEILEEVKHFYKTLYKNQINIQDNEIQILLQSLSQYPKLSVEETNLLNGELTEQEIVFVLKKMKNNKSPGSDGFTAEFYKFFYKDLKVFIRRAINEGYNEGKLSIT